MAKDHKKGLIIRVARLNQRMIQANTPNARLPSLDNAKTPRLVPKSEQNHAFTPAPIVPELLICVPTW
jgi:hypothetical protein